VSGRFGTDGTQYLLRNYLSPSAISAEAGRIECDDERHVFLNTQYNLFHLAPSEPAALPEDLTRLSRVATVDFGGGANSSDLQARAQQSQSPAPVPAIISSANGDRGGALRLQLSVDVSSDAKVNEQLTSDFSYKRCAAEAGVGEPANTLVASPRLQRRKTSCSSMEESGMFDRGYSDRSMSIDDYAANMGQCALHSSSSMSEGDDDECSNGSSYCGDGFRMKGKKRVKFVDEPIITTDFDGDY
jgi:hypothetical protein